ncbi:arylesterase [Shewanella canadensis]|uniref:Arylesterase n=1 Tax=Shewanella canadensis TaxID=271096 RepID=A0A3S0RZC2_9GAMM|nr:arylesterase [Shewanella canadensis]RTR39904.1 arylesterase [Shewanella canadensis]
MKRVLAGLFSIALFLLSACSGPKLEPLSSDAEIWAFGDSLTYGKGAARGQDYPTMLAGLSQKRVINAGVSGETTTQGLDRLTQLLEYDSPDLLILMEGGNDFLRNQNIGQTKANLAQMIELAQRRSIPVVLVAVPRKGIFLSPAALYSELAETYGVILIEDELTDLLKTAAMKSDTIHLNGAGYRALAEVIHRRLIQVEAL